MSCSENVILTKKKQIPNVKHYNIFSAKYKRNVKTTYTSGAGAGLAQGQGWRSGGDRENNYTRFYKDESLSL